MDFEKELNKLLALQSDPLPQLELAELLAAERQLLQALNKKQTDISLQIEEIYDITKDMDNRVLQDIVRDEKARGIRLAGTVIELCDLIDDFYEYTMQSGSEELEHQARLMQKNAGVLLEKCGITRIGEAGQRLDPEIHSARSGAVSSVSREHVVKVLQSGYRYLGALIRKAAVVVSLGIDAERCSRIDEQNRWN